MPSRRLLLRVVDFIAGEVADDKLSEELRHFTEGEYGYFSLSAYTSKQASKQAEEIMAVIRESLLPAVAEWYPGDDEVHDFVAELVDLVKQVQALEPIGQNDR
ncbi:hypothetical protein AVR91_0220730 [Amycolatopsis keratiniphila subsp. keratiniphila]|uniref:Uncharacterized protein n=2 Tax=Amycolatopsis keratiniphila TaxID=129921 RepID=A0A1W2LT98_9PSEU|nr:hypothetical protein AVR91_0220730 [Amycolatopsis keratiniphila subsp. keratiniphila]